MSNDLGSHLFESFLRTVKEVRARARLSLLVRYCAQSFHKHKRVIRDTESLVVWLSTKFLHTTYVDGNVLPGGQGGEDQVRAEYRLGP